MYLVAFCEVRILANSLEKLPNRSARTISGTPQLISRETTDAHEERGALSAMRARQLMVCYGRTGVKRRRVLRRLR